MATASLSAINPALDPTSLEIGMATEASGFFPFTDPVSADHLMQMILDYNTHCVS